MKWLIKKILLDLLKDDYEVQITVTRVANPELADEIERPLYLHCPPFTKSQGWWNGGLSKDSYAIQTKRKSSSPLIVAPEQWMNPWDNKE